MSDPSTRLLVQATVESLQAEVRELRGRLAVASVALHRYGEHEEGCDARVQSYPSGEFGVCTCGFDSAMERP